MDIRHEPERQRFVAETNGGGGVLEYRGPAGGVIDYHHTFVPPELRGRGIAGELVEFALGYARDQGLKVRPTCPFVRRIVDSKPEYAALRAD